MLHLGDQSHVAERVGQVETVRAGILGLLAGDQDVLAAQRIGRDEVVAQTGRLRIDHVPDHIVAAARNFGVEAGLLKREDFRMNVELRTGFAPFLGFRMIAERVFPADGRVDDQKTAEVAAAVMAAADPDDAGRVGELARVLERGREVRAAPVQFGLVRSVRVHVEQDPAVVVHDVAVFPAQIHDPAVFQRRGMPVRILLEGELADLFRFRVDLVDVRHQVAAVNAGETLQAGVRTADDRAVRRIAGVEEVDVGLVGRRKGLEVFAVEPDFEDRPVAVFFGDARKEDPFAVPVEFRFADRPGVLGAEDRGDRRLFVSQVADHGELVVPPLPRNVQDRQEVVVRRGDVVGADDEEFQVVQKRVRQERLAPELGEFRLPRRVTVRFGFERVEFVQVRLAAGVVVSVPVLFPASQSSARPAEQASKPRTAVRTAAAKKRVCFPNENCVIVCEFLSLLTCEQTVKQTNDCLLCFGGVRLGTGPNRSSGVSGRKSALLSVSPAGFRRGGVCVTRPSAPSEPR